jgi:signal transduction histidine kinase
MASANDRAPSGYSPLLLAGREGLPQLWGRQGLWQIRLRWAVAPLMIAGIVLGRQLGFEFRVVPILAIALASPIYNGVLALVFRRYRQRLETDPRLNRIFITTEVVADYAAMFLLIYFTGGASSPLTIFLLFHVIIAAIQFTATTAYGLAGVAAGGLWLLYLGEAGGWLPCHHLTFHGVPLNPAEQSAYAILILASLTATLFITAGIVSRISARLRRRVGDLAEASSHLARSHAAIQALMQERAEFTLEVAHNLRAPLAAGLSIVDLLREGYVGELTDSQRQHLDRLDQRLRGLNEMVGKLLAIARTRDRSREIEDVLVDLRKLARHTRETFRGVAKDRGLELRVTVEEDLPPVASGVGLLEQLMENLVSNAVKYTPEGGEVSVRFESDGPGLVRISVEDSGIGIPVAEQDRLFQEFYRASNARELTREGTGLGLVLVKQTVDRHNGSLELESGEGEGTRFVVRLPVDRDATATAGRPGT